ncbi:MAG: Rpn family recombination-promoting nuclease/putative transposase [Fibrobacter sp.]|nr:Rpn family recombination-promoting nuclease/putative transposase [Fibrobacter sp.]
MNKTQHEALLSAIKTNKNLFETYKQIYKYAYILSDGIFKVVFAQGKNHTLLISLLNAMLNLQGGKAIKEVTLEMQEFPGIFNKKTCILDIIGTTNANEKVLVEIQQKGDVFFRDRLEYYMARVIENQVHKSEKYELPPIYFLGLLDFEMFPEEPTKYIHHVDEMCNGRKFFPKIQKVLVEIDKFFELENAGVTAGDATDAAQWLRAIKSIVKEEAMPEMLIDNPIFLQLQNDMKLCNFEEELFNVEADNMTDLKFEHECGVAEGKAEGRAIGKAEGFAEGRKSIAQKLIVKNFPLKEIAEITELTEEEILAIKSGQL